MEGGATVSRVLSFALRFFVSATFALSGILKLQAPDRFLIDLQAFSFVPAWIAYGVSLTLPWLEVFVALGLWTKRLAKGAALLAGGMALGFIAVLLLAELRGLELDCGCFGEWLVFPNLFTHLAFNAVLAASSFWFLRESE